MHTQQLLPICGLLLASIAIASKLDRDDVPNRCWPACSSVVGIAKSCDAKYERDSAEIQCICDWDAAKTEIPLCSACITQYQTDRRNHNITHHDDDNDDDDDDDDNDDDNEALDLVRSCSLTTTTYSAAATTLIGTSTSTESTSTATSSTATITDSSSTSGGSQDSTSSVSSGSSDSAGASSGSASSPTPTPDAAASISAPGATSMLGFMGLMAFAWL
ncbi:hypothetical protein DTO027I6_5306 [Penicillium roqueforti]|uniref:uncharacterized protein n=1 Tax=Penicillium roqueforti TaxID=5082 RepID=UPI00190C64DE|nr:uncharacterized protein LCP9604111_6552 [Penicillium roqueforti]KAF9246792.1 hypothetical protein LCP9604111_6552 [Penicillium roqueforti]KAI3205307.1 hypothetical protein DTO027I6_5306 [Penicillium roqueforti]KAI3245603.1 hypothetical protein DTO012A7_1582 [Penicillium roqueforti]